MSANASFTALLLTLLLVGCTPDRQEGAGEYDDLGLSLEEQAEIDAILDSARTAAADAARAREWEETDYDPIAEVDATEDRVLDDERRDEVTVAGTAAGGVAAGEGRRAWPTPEALRYRHYRNMTHGYGFDYPDNLFQQGEAIGGDRGQAFETADGSATLLVYATEADGADALRTHFESELDRPDQEVTYQRIKGDWFVVSGYDGPYIFYQRTFRAGDALRTFELRHLARDKDYFGPVTERLSHSFSG